MSCRYTDRCEAAALWSALTSARLLPQHLSVWLSAMNMEGRKQNVPRCSRSCMPDIWRVPFRLKWHGQKPQLNSSWPCPHVIFFPPLSLTCNSARDMAGSLQRSIKCPSVTKRLLQKCLCSCHPGSKQLTESSTIPQRHPKTFLQTLRKCLESHRHVTSVPSRNSGGL